MSQPEKKVTYFWALINFNNAEKDPAKMSWEPVRAVVYSDEANRVYYDIFGSDEGVREKEIVVFGKVITGP